MDLFRVSKTDHVTCFHFRSSRTQRLSTIPGSLQNISKLVISGSARSSLRTALYSNTFVRSTRTRSSSKRRSSPSSGPRTTRAEPRRLTCCSRSNRPGVVQFLARHLLQFHHFTLCLTSCFQSSHPSAISMSDYTF